MQANPIANSATKPALADRVVAAVANGSRSIDRAWHQLRAARPPLETWQAFAHVCRSRGRKYDNRWARHQFQCWSELSDAGTYPRQREEWLANKPRSLQRWMPRAAAFALTPRSVLIGNPSKTPRKQLELFD